MENQAMPASERGLNSGAGSIFLSPRIHPPPWTMTAAGNGPLPSGTDASRRRLIPPAREYSMSVRISAAAATVLMDRRRQMTSILYCDAVNRSAVACPFQGDAIDLKTDRRTIDDPTDFGDFPGACDACGTRF